jgi:hypothetical protein
MQITKKLLISATLLLGTGWAVSATEPQAVIWVDSDAGNIPEPKDRKIGFVDNFVRPQVTGRWKRGTDLGRLARMTIGAPKQATNVNAVDEVPDSSWYTNRHGLRPMTMADLTRGPGSGEAPDLAGATITDVKLEGVTPGFRVKDKKGDSYLIKFDNSEYPELQSGAEAISTRILYAAGYNVPENYVASIDPGKLEIESDVKLGKEPFTRDELKKMLEKVRQSPNGTYRVLASKILKGKAKGPFAYVGLRGDDPNDLIPHEHRRELRGLRVIASWINHWDLKEQNTLDMYVEEGGRKFLRHYLIDFGSSLGGGKNPLEYFHGREYAFDTKNILKELFSLGFYVTPDEKSATLIYPEIGIFSAEDFKPDEWEPSVHVMAFDNMTSRDALWAARILMSFSEDEILGIVKTARFSNPKVTDYMHRTLLARRKLVVREWMKDVNAISNFSLESGSDGVVLKFDDLAAAQHLADQVEYRYEISGNSNGGERRKDQASTTALRIPLGQTLSGETKIKIWTTRDRRSFSPVTVVVNTKPGGNYGIFRIERS